LPKSCIGLTIADARGVNAERFVDSQLDTIDLMILRELQQDGRLSVVDLAQRVGLSPSPCLRRLRALEERGTIVGYRAMLDQRAIGLGLQIFVFFRCASYDRGELQRLRETVKVMPEVLASYNVSGDFDGMLQVVVPDLPSFERFMHEKLLRLNVRDVRTSFVIGGRQVPAPLPLGHLDESVVQFEADPSG
jgi:Lrp/AsnC family leucine-responsive transcriptional regulator